MNCISFDEFLAYRLCCANERVPEMQVTIYLANGQVSVVQLGKVPVELALSSVRPSSSTFSYFYSSPTKLHFYLKIGW
jgi:hypothetical protein